MALSDGRISRTLPFLDQPAQTDSTGIQVALVPMAAFCSDDGLDDVQAFHRLGRSHGGCRSLQDDVDLINGDSHRPGTLLQTESLVHGLPNGLYAGNKQQEHLPPDGRRFMRPMQKMSEGLPDFHLSR